MGWSQTWASGTVSPDMHRVNLDYLRCFCKGPFTKKPPTPPKKQHPPPPRNISCFDHNVKDNYQTLLSIWCLFLCCCCIFHKLWNFGLTFPACTGFAHLHIPVWWNSSSSEANVFLKYILYSNSMHINICNTCLHIDKVRFCVTNITEPLRLQSLHFEGRICYFAEVDRLKG